MDFIKKNPLMTACMVVAACLAIFFGLKIRAAAASAAEAGAEVDKLKAFFQKELEAAYSASTGNLEQSGKNLAKAKIETENLRRRLYAQSQVDYNARVSNTQCKNFLQEGTEGFMTQLKNELITVENDARHFSFGDVLNSEKLPNEAVEVPVLMKQFEIVREIVGLLEKSQITRLISLRRNQGVGVASQNDFILMPFSMSVEGDSASVKDLLTRLQKESRYFFVVRKVAFSGADTTIGSGIAQAGMERAQGIMERSQGMDMPTEEEKAFAEQSQVHFPDLVKADIRFDFIEFKNPVEEN